MEARRMNSHACNTNKPTDSSADPGTTAPPPNLSRTRVRISPPNSLLPGAPAVIYTANLWRDKHLGKFSLAIDTKHRVLVCQLHQVVLNGSIQAIENHLKHQLHSMAGFHLSVSSISGVLDQWRIQSEKPQQPTHAVVPVSGIKPPRAGYQCPECSYAVGADEAARKHANSSGGHKMKCGQVQRVQNIYWKILPEEDWEMSCCADLRPEDFTLINNITDSLMNPRVEENETDDV